MNESRFRIQPLILIFVALGVLTSPAQAIELITNGGFETGTFAGWTRTNSTSDELTPWTVGGFGGGWFANTAPLAGSFDAYNGFDGASGLVYELYQDVSIPALTTATLSTNHRIVYDGLGIISTLNRVFEISIRNVSNSVLAPLYSQSVTMNGAPLTDLGWNAKSFDVSTFAGSTVRVHFREFIPESYTGPANIELDKISLIALPTPEPSSAALVAFIAALAVLVRKRRQN